MYVGTWFHVSLDSRLVLGTDGVASVRLGRRHCGHELRMSNHEFAQFAWHATLQVAHDHCGSDDAIRDKQMMQSAPGAGRWVTVTIPSLRRSFKMIIKR